MTTDNKTTVVLTVVVGLLALVAIIISAVSLAKNQSPTVTVQSGGGGYAPSAGGQGPPPQVINNLVVGGDGGDGGVPGNNWMGSSGRIYSLAIGHDYGAHEYFDDAGYLSGFGISMIDLVCGEAEIDCRIMWDTYTNCWDSSPGQHPTGGQGLMGGWYDACTGWYQTVDRIHVFSFSQPYLKAPVSNFYVLFGKTLDTSKENIKNSKIVFLDGWASDEKCVARTVEAVLQPKQIMYAQTTEEAVKLLKGPDNWVALFTTETTLRGHIKDDVLVKQGPDYSCMLDGNSMMSRKDNDLVMAWNRGYSKVRSNGRFRKLCESSNKIHSAKGYVECL